MAQTVEFWWAKVVSVLLVLVAIGSGLLAVFFLGLGIFASERVPEYMEFVRAQQQMQELSHAGYLMATGLVIFAGLCLAFRHWLWKRALSERAKDDAAPLGSDQPPRRSLAAGLGICIIFLLAIPVPLNFAKMRISSSTEWLRFKIRVVDRQTRAPIAGAEVQIVLGDKAFLPFGPSEIAVTDLNGQGTVTAQFPAGIRETLAYKKGRYYITTFDIRLRVSAPGYQPWEQPLKDLLGERYSLSRGHVIAHEAALVKSKP